MNTIRVIVLTLVIALTSVTDADAQSRVKNITISVDMFDLTASTEQRLDNNHNPCGLLKVNIPAENVIFKGNIIGEVARHGDTYWVYVTNGTKEIRMDSPALGEVPLRFADWNIPHIQSKAVYKVTVELTEPAAGVTPTKRGYVQFSLSPTNASIVFNGQQLDVTDGTAYKLVPYGTYKYTVQAVGHEPYSSTVQVNSNKVQVPVKLLSNKARVTVTAETPGCTIYVDGAMKGKSPWQGELMPGDYIVEARREGYRSREVSVTLAASSQRDIAIPALAMITGELTVEYQPIGSQVTLDGKAVGTTPALLTDIPVGTHTLAISSPGYDTATLNVSVSENSTAPISGTLTKTPDKYVVNSTPSQNANNTGSTVTGTVYLYDGEPAIGASIFLQGQTGGGTVADIDGNFSIRVPNPNASLVVKYFDCKTQTVKLKGKSHIKVHLKKKRW